jgi:hypothetical protein
MKDVGCSILVSFPAGADYLGAGELEKADVAQSG